MGKFFWNYLLKKVWFRYYLGCLKDTRELLKKFKSTILNVKTKIFYNFNVLSLDDEFFSTKVNKTNTALILVVLKPRNMVFINVQNNQNLKTYLKHKFINLKML